MVDIALRQTGDPPMSNKSQVRVMIVEDEPSFQDLVQLVLSLDPRFSMVHAAGTGEDAVANLEEAAPDLVLVDFRLPGIDGLETAKRIKDRRPDVTIAMVTAHTEEVLSRFAKEAQIQVVIPKATFSLEQVQRLVD